MHHENIIYAEIRFGSTVSENDNIKCAEVIEAVLRGLDRGKKDFGIDYGLIVRNETSQRGNKIDV